ncbi:hypothetical protein EVAR_15708_1 [Eumeta japonica]|uniref:Uncharacterized protein n=1 Tax=Eumeta variegata TaxID=151549 RepID=A0A4C1UAV5_EUMVA|nr:hypothetical protein EVAR_15708_1 [Eumeta japonica]
MASHAFPFSRHDFPRRYTGHVSTGTAETPSMTAGPAMPPRAPARAALSSPEGGDYSLLQCDLAPSTRRTNGSVSFGRARRGRGERTRSRSRAVESF